MKQSHNRNRLAKTLRVLLPTALTAALGIGLLPAAISAAGPGKIEAESYAAMNGIQTEATTDAGGGLDVGWIDAGDWLDYAVVIPAAGTYTVSLRVASPSGAAGGALLKNGTTVLATYDVPATGGWQTWTTVTQTVTLAAGTQTLRLAAAAGGWNVNWLDIQSSDGTATAQVYLSSESTTIAPKSGSWYSNTAGGMAGVPYQLSKQGDVTLTAPTGASAAATINVDPSIQYQTMLGIGTSLEESTVYNISRMSAAKQDEVLRKLVDPVNGAGMNLIRIAFGTSDFTERTFYTYDDGTADPNLTRFSIQKDIDYNIIATVKKALAINPNIKVFASSWTAPNWMKDNNSLIGGHMLTQYIPNLATYYRKAIQAYQAQGIPIYALTPQNEPLYLAPDYPSMGLTVDQERQLIVALKSEFDANGISTKIWAFDHNFSDASYATQLLANASANAAIDSTAFHDYGGSPTTMTDVHNAYPGKNVLVTERSVWGTAGADRIAQYFRNWATGYVAWVTMLDTNISPEQWTGVPDPTFLIQSASNPNTYWALPEYNMEAQYSKFVKAGAKRIASDYGSTGAVTNVSFLNPDNTIVSVVINQNASSKTFKLVAEGKELLATIPAQTVGTYIWNRTGSGTNPQTNLLANPGLESGTLSGWTGEWHAGALAQKVDTDNPQSGSYKLTHWANVAYQQLTSQLVAVPNGTYQASVWVRSGGGQNALRLFAKNYGGAEKTAEVGSAAVANWTQYTISNIQVTNGQVELGIWSDANANNWSAFDSFSLFKTN
ncbi:carbohydrate-binding protein [Paenibacillus athensensis]|uniref:Glycosyl hydrolase n=1 Tax=Paenibacillus athensensis TaxID=1967502 RepID=A0A4Y8Q188_9BACL|nr:carbohydrate-binding protein [Paenibacillus athensensis]MCD1261163.1 carbohydrate-binding protein [Paenibacillus athensensis]